MIFKLKKEGEKIEKSVALDKGMYYVNKYSDLWAQLYSSSYFSTDYMNEVSLHYKCCSSHPEGADWFPFSCFISLEYEHLLSDVDLVGLLGSSLSCLEGGGGLLTYVITTGTTVNKPNVMALFGTVALRERLINVHLPVESIPAILTGWG